MASEANEKRLREMIDSVCYLIGRCVATDWRDDSPKHALRILRARAIKHGYVADPSRWNDLPLPYEGAEDLVCARN